MTRRMSADFNGWLNSAEHLDFQQLTVATERFNANSHCSNRLTIGYTFLQITLPIGLQSTFIYLLVVVRFRLFFFSLSLSFSLSLFLSFSLLWRLPNSLQYQRMNWTCFQVKLYVLIGLQVSWTFLFFFFIESMCWKDSLCCCAVFVGVVFSFPIPICFCSEWPSWCNRWWRNALAMPSEVICLLRSKWAAISCVGCSSGGWASLWRQGVFSRAPSATALVSRFLYFYHMSVICIKSMN